MKNIEGNITIKEDGDNLIISTKISKEELRRYLLENKLNNESVIFTNKNEIVVTKDINLNKSILACNHNDGKEIRVEKINSGKDKGKVICLDCGTKFNLLSLEDFIDEKIEINENLFDLLHTIKLYTLFTKNLKICNLSLIEDLLNKKIELNHSIKDSLLLTLRNIRNETSIYKQIKYPLPMDYNNPFLDRAYGAYGSGINSSPFFGYNSKFHD